MEEWIPFLMFIAICVFIVSKAESLNNKSDVIKREDRDGYRYTYRGTKLISKRKIKQ